jgi:hypothetical protein
MIKDSDKIAYFEEVSIHNRGDITLISTSILNLS